jgi:hypothetical protein
MLHIRMSSGTHLFHTPACVITRCSILCRLRYLKCYIPPRRILTIFCFFVFSSSNISRLGLLCRMRDTETFCSRSV